MKSLQTNSIQILDDSGATGEDDAVWVPRILKKTKAENEQFDQVWHERRLKARYTGAVQCDASDKRRVILPDGTQMETTLLVIGEFDILAAGLFAFREEWDFGFALNSDLPRSTHKGYTPEARRYLLKSLVPVTWPLRPPFVRDPFSLLDRLVRERQ